MKVIKKVITTVVVAMMVLCNSMAYAVENVTGVVNTETLRLRKDASIDSIVLELLSKDDKVEILEEKDGWYKIKFNDYTGYVSKEFISVSGKVQTNENTTENENSSETGNPSETPITTESNSSTVMQGSVEVKNKVAEINEDAKLYILPLINSNVITNLSKSTGVNIINTAGGWAYVSSDSVSGWIRLDKLSISNSNVNGETTNSEESSSQTNTAEGNKQTEFSKRNAYVNSSSVNVRVSPNTSSEIVTALSQNTQVELVGEDNGWYKVEVNGESGYILKTLVSDKKVEVTSRSVAPTRETAQTNTNEGADTKTTSTTSNTATQNEVKSNSTQQTNTAGNQAEKQESSNVTSNESASKGEQVVAYAKNYLGCKYVYAGSGPNVFDCSGFTMYVYKHFGFSMGHSAVTQARIGSYVSRNSLQAGDLIIFNNEANSSIGHVGIYVGGGNFIHASSGSGKVVISSLSNAYYNARYVTARRIF